MHQEFAKPSLIILDGEWDFLHAINQHVATPIEVRKIVVPGVWQAQFADLRMRSGSGIYRREFEIPRDWLQERVFLRFGAVFHNTRVWVNGTLVGANEGGFLPFSFDVTEALREGTNEIKLRVESPTDDPTEFPETPLAEIPFGKQSWYGPLAGIWQTVYLERRIREHMERLRITPELATGRVRVRIFFAHSLIENGKIDAAVLDPEGRVVASTTDTALGGMSEMGMELLVPDVRSWSPKEPHLYKICLSFRRNHKIIDSKEENFGFRTIATRDGKFYLNGEHIYIRAALDQDYYSGTICTLPSVECVEDEFRKAKELGLNCLRCHIKAADPRYYEAADRLGLLIWTELPNGGMSTERSRTRKEMTLKGIVDRDGNHPSIIIWTIINENWGVDLVHDVEHRAWLRRMYHWLKAYDPTRLVVDNSPLAPSFHVETDIVDFHFYAAFPDSRADWDQFVNELASCPAWAYSPEGDAVCRGDEPLMCSEFGNWGLPYPPDLKDENGQEPWWFETGHDWGEGIMYAHGVENRFADWSLDRVFGSLKTFIEAAQWQQFRALKYEIESMRRKPTLAGYVITELTDCHWESNGLMDMRRNRRVFHDVFHTINADTVIVPKWERVSYWGGETASIELSVAHGGAAGLEGATLLIKFTEERRIDLPRLEAGTVLCLGAVRLELPKDGESGLKRVTFEVRDGEGRLIAGNYLDLAIHAGRRKPALEKGYVWSSDPETRERLAALGYSVTNSLDQATLAIVFQHNSELQAYTRRGGRLLLLPKTEGTLQPLFPHWQNVKVLSREGTLWRGDWASCFSWLRRREPFSHIPGGPLLDETFDRVLPTHVISGCNLLDFQARVHAGLVVGWIHKPVALSVERGYGNGRFVASTFRLFRDDPGADPTATMLLDSLINLALAQGTAASREAGAPLLASFG